MATRIVTWLERLIETLQQAGVSPLWDNDLFPGTGFSAQIKSFIANSHMFLPFITAASAQRPWLHQEIGFATALGKPVLPVTLNCLPEGIISDIQMVQLLEDLADAPLKLSAEFFHRFWDSVPESPASYECAEDNVRRALLLADYANSVWAIRKYGQVRQMASLTTFHLPDRGAGDPVWRKYFPATPDNGLLFDALRRERVALQKHARVGGCRLILDPVERLRTVYAKHGSDSIGVRINEILKFLRDDSIPDVVVAINDDEARTASLTLVGDWFSSEAVSSGGTRIMRESLFTRHAPTIRRQIEDFDNRMHDLLVARGWNETSSRAQAVSYLQSYLEMLSDRH